MPSARSSRIRRAAAALIAGLALTVSAVAAQDVGRLDDAGPGEMPEISVFVPAKQLFGRVRSAAPLSAAAIGGYARGCLAGAVEIAADGPAWQVMRPSRNRAWGHPELVALVERLAREAKAEDGWNGLLVGDLAQPRGGPMLTGHASHQIGLDADIWLTPMPSRTLTRAERETMSATLVAKDRFRVDPKVWTAAHARLIKRAASYRQVDRIFVHPPIKKALCEWAGGRGDWLRKVRPIYGHDYHFHIRIGCPKGSAGCKDQAAPTPKDGTGCGDELAYWYSEEPWRPKKQPPAKPSPPQLVNGVPLPRPKPVAAQNIVPQRTRRRVGIAGAQTIPVEGEVAILAMAVAGEALDLLSVQKHAALNRGHQAAQRAQQG